MFINESKQKVYTIDEIELQIIDLRNNTIICMQNSNTKQLQIIDKLYSQLYKYICDIYKSVI